MRSLLTAIAGAGAALAGAAAITRAFRRDMARARARISGRSEVIASPFGHIEFTRGGIGFPVLVVHGSGGGFDQGEFLARLMLDEDVHRIIPSRFGYLRSSCPAGATFDDQAHAYACLLDRLGLPRVAVVAFSHGGPSALLFAVLHPNRVSSLILLSAGVASSEDVAQRRANRQGSALAWIYQRNLRYWVVTRLLRRRLLGLMGAGPAVVTALGPEQRQMAAGLIEVMHPVEPRAAGVAFDHRAAMPNGRIAAIRAPTLIVHARDDTLQRFHNAEFAARTIPGARLVAFERGGHLVAALEHEQVRALVMRHLRAHAAR